MNNNCINHPLANRDFLQVLENSGSVGESSGWIPHHIEKEDAFLPGYIKFHSYGEYIFDWAWAQFYEQNSLDYYPKLLHAIPFSPVNAPKFLGDQNHFLQLAQDSFIFYQNHSLSSEHYLFINDNEEMILKTLGFETLLTHQYHFNNRFESFDHYLSELKKNKRKNIKKERRSIIESGLEINRYTKNNISDDILKEIYLFYLSTIAKKGSYAYLTQKFFNSLPKEQTLIICAQKDQETIAMALFFYNEKTLYGRNWGINPKYKSDYPNLHFELCYYQGIEFCIKNNISKFEAGAQGEHKLTRGFEPVIIKSAHHIKIPQCYDIIKKDIQRQNEQTHKTIKYLKTYLPFKQ